jgi:hypothetical protein
VDAPRASARSSTRPSLGTEWFAMQYDAAANQRQHRPNAARRPRVGTHPVGFPARIGMHPTPAPCQPPGRAGPAQAPIGALPRPANDAHTGRPRPQSQGGSQPPRHNAQAFDEARKRINVARCRACCSPLASVVGAPSAGPSGEHPPAGGPALLGSTVRWYPSPTWGHGHGASGECSPHGGRAHDGALAALPRSMPGVTPPVVPLRYKE